MLPAPALAEAAERDSSVIAMIESAAGLAAVDQIAATPGIDMLMIGTNDLADGIGLRGQTQHPALLEAFRRIATAARDNLCGFGIMGLPPELIQSHAIALGATAIVVTNETNLISQGGAALLRTIKPT